jgi:hypothetical protein
MSNAKNSVIERARSWGFICQLTEGDSWQISPAQSQETWQLSILAGEDRWLLSARKVPQIYLSEAEAIVFLERRRSLPPNDHPAE